MATVCATLQCVAVSRLSFSHASSSSVHKSVTTLAVPITQDHNGHLNARSSSSEERISRREAMTVAGGAGLAGLLFLLPVGSAEARNTKPETRKKIREELEKLRERAENAPEEIKKSVEELIKK